MNVSSSSVVQAVSQAAQSVAGVAATLALKKALESDSSVAQTLLKSAPTLAATGAIGTLINTFT
jgi:hypothetical protein